MSCYGCGTTFGTFKKEHGCKNCGFAFCSKCIPNKLPIPKLNNEKHKVCMKCYNIMTGKVKPKEDAGRYSPPENYKKRMAALEEREAGGHGSGGASSSRGYTAPVAAKSRTNYAGMSKADIEIQERLDKLREKTPAEKAAGQVTARELDDRLAKMKGMDPSRYNAPKPTYHPPDRRSQQEQMNDLLDEISNEVELDSHLPDPVQEIQARLARLKEPIPGANTASNTAADDDDNENNLNKPSLRDSQTFSQNISTLPKKPETRSVSGSKPTGEDKKGTSSTEDDVSMEDVGRILNEAAQELEQDAAKALKGLEEDKEIMKKLQEIKQRRKQSSTDVNKDEMFENSESENEGDNENKLADNIIKQAMEEDKLDEAAAKDGVNVAKTKSKTAAGAKDGVQTDAKKSTSKKAKKVNNDEEWYDPDELPYCCICTEDAIFRCLGCDHDLYCNSCFRDGHKELGLTDHVTLKYTAPPDNT